MPNNLKNWTYRDVSNFLKEKGFTINHIRGSHYYFVGTVNKEVKHVTVPYHGNNVSIDQRVMKSIIIQSGIDKKVWFN